MAVKYIIRWVALVQTGDRIELDVPARKLNVLIADNEMARRRAAWKPPAPKFERGYGTLYLKHVTQANEGCDFDFLEPVARRAANFSQLFPHPAAVRYAAQFAEYQRNTDRTIPVVALEPTE